MKTGIEGSNPARGRSFKFLSDLRFTFFFQKLPCLRLLSKMENHLTTEYQWCQLYHLSKAELKILFSFDHPTFQSLEIFFGLIKYPYYLVAKGWVHFSEQTPRLVFFYNWFVMRTSYYINSCTLLLHVLCELYVDVLSVRGVYNRLFCSPSPLQKSARFSLLETRTRYSYYERESSPFSCVCYCSACDTSAELTLTWGVGQGAWKTGILEGKIQMDWNQFSNDSDLKKWILF